MAIDEMKKIHISIKKKIKQCIVCFEAWSVKDKVDLINYMCTRCLRDKGSPKRSSAENNLVPSEVPQKLLNLTHMEEMLICRAFPVRHVFGTTCYKGHVITIPHKVQNIADILPHFQKDLPIITFTLKKYNNKNYDFKIRRQKVLDALIWLTQNNPLYHQIHLDYERINSLPVDDYLDVQIVSLAQSESDIAYDEGPSATVENELKSQSQFTSSLPANQSQPLEQDRIQDTISGPHSMDVASDPINEFSTPFLATLAFSTIFPDGKGYPTDNNTIRQISQIETESFSSKLKHLIKFGEKRCNPS